MAESERSLPLRRAESAAGFVLIVQTVAGLVALLLGFVSRSVAAQAAAWQLLVGAVVWLSCLMHQRLRRLADEETREAEALKAEQQAEGTSLFEADGGVLLTAQTRLNQFEKYFLPVFSVVIMVALGVLSYFLLRKLVAGPAAKIDRGMMAAVVFMGLAFVSFLLAKYTAGLATQKPWRAVRSGANYTMSCAATCFLVSLALGCSQFEIPEVERVVAYAVSGLLALLAAEVLLLLVMGIYRPRVEGREPRWAHDSRLLGMLTTSSGILRTTAETLDYQFGFRVSETWFYKFLERAIAPLILFQIVTLYLLTCFVIVDEGEQAIVERFGAPPAQGEVLGPGLHLKWPWPIECARKHRVQRVEMLQIGEQLEEDVEGYLWTVSHAKEDFSLIVAIRPDAEERTPVRPSAPALPPAVEGNGAREKERAAPAVGMLSGTVFVYYHVNNLHDYLYKHKDPRRTLEEVSYRELTRYAARNDFLDLLGPKLGAAAEALAKSIQESADELELGVRIDGVTLRGLHPPATAAAAFEAVVGAMQERETQIWEARAYEAEIVPEAEAKAVQELNDATAYATNRAKVTPAIARRLLAQFEVYRQAPKVFRHRTYIRALESALAGSRKIIRPVWGKNVDEELHFDLTDTLRELGVGFDLESSEIEEGATP